MENWTLTWTKLISLEAELIKEISDNTPGVYRFSYQATSGIYVFYIGQSTDLKSRLLKHLSEDTENVCIKNYLITKKCFFRYAIISEKYIRDAAERKMYKQYEPTCNDREPEGREDINVNLT